MRGHVRIFYLLTEKAEGRGELVLNQKANGRDIGGFRTVIDMLRPEAVKLVADTRTGLLYSLDRNPEAMHAIPIELKTATAAKTLELTVSGPGTKKGGEVRSGFKAHDLFVAAPIVYLKEWRDRCGECMHSA